MYSKENSIYGVSFENGGKFAYIDLFSCAEHSFNTAVSSRLNAEVVYSAPTDVPYRGNCNVLIRYRVLSLLVS